MSFVEFLLTILADMDMLEIGTWSMTELEEQTHFAFWAALKSPLIIGADLNNISDTSMKILRNEELIEINQDDAGVAARYLPALSKEGEYQVWAGRLSSGERRSVLLVLNDGTKNATVSIPTSSILSPGGSSNTTFQIRDVWAGRDLGPLGSEIVLHILPTQTKVLVIKA